MLFYSFLGYIICNNLKIYLKYNKYILFHVFKKYNNNNNNFIHLELQMFYL